MPLPLVFRRFLLACALLGLAGCSVKVHRVPVDTARLVAPVEARLACDHQLRDIVDARSSSDRAGGLGNHLFLFDDVPGTVRKQFAQAGLATQATGPVVDVRILQFYLSQNLTTKIPVAVYEVRVDNASPFLVRSQRASMNWNGSENEAYEAYSTALADATAQVVNRLNAGCPKAG